MVQVNTLLKVVDKTGVSLVRCIKVLTSLKSRIAYIGDVLVVGIRRINPKRYKRAKFYRKKNYLKGTIHRALLIRGCFNFKRFSGVFIKFNENSVVLVNKKKVPISNRIYGPVLRELCMDCLL